MAATCFNLGATILIGIECYGATNDDVVGATCAGSLKPAAQTVDGYAVPPASTPTVADFVVTPRAASADVGPGWDMSIDAATAETLGLGTFVSTAVLTLASGLVVKTVPLFITLTQATT